MTRLRMLLALTTTLAWACKDQAALVLLSDAGTPMPPPADGGEPISPPPPPPPAPPPAPYQLDEETWVLPNTNGGAYLQIVRDSTNLAAEPERFIVARAVGRGAGTIETSRFDDTGGPLWIQTTALAAGEEVIGVQGADSNGTNLIIARRAAAETTIAWTNLTIPTAPARSTAIAPDRNLGRLAGQSGSWTGLVSYSSATDAAGDHHDAAYHFLIGWPDNDSTTAVNTAGAGFRDPIVAYGNTAGFWMTMIQNSRLHLLRLSSQNEDRGEMADCDVAGHYLITDSHNAVMSIDCADRIELRAEWWTLPDPPPVKIASTTPAHPGVISRLAYDGRGDVGIVYWPAGAPGPSVRFYRLHTTLSENGELHFTSPASSPSALPISVDIATKLHDQWGVVWSDSEHTYFSRFTRGAPPRPTPSAPVKILLVVDNSMSMTLFQSMLDGSLPALIDPLRASGIDYTIGVISTDLSTPGGEVAGSAYIRQDFIEGHVTGVEDRECASAGIAHGCVRGLVHSAQSDQIFALSNIIRSSCSTAPEQGLEAMLAAFDQTAPGGCNSAFRSTPPPPDEKVVLIFFSNDDDAGAIAAGDVLSQLATHVPYDRLRVAVIGGALGGEAARCGEFQINDPTALQCGTQFCDPTQHPMGSLSPCTSSATCGDQVCGAGGRCVWERYENWSPETCHRCEVFDVENCCWAQAATRYADFARALELEAVAADPSFTMTACDPAAAATRRVCLIESLCQSQYGDTLDRIARELVLETP